MNNGGKISLKYLSTLILTLLFFCITVNSSARYYRNPRSDPRPIRRIPFRKISFLHQKIPSSSIQHCWIHCRFIPTASGSRWTRFMSLIPKIRWMRRSPTVRRTPSCLMCPPRISHYIIRPIPNIKDIDLDAYNIRMDQANSLLLATYARDTSGAMIGRPKMIQAETKMESDSMVFNMKTQKGHHHEYLHAKR